MENGNIASHVLMIRPNTFGFNEQTAKTNTFQHRPDEDTASVNVRAEHEFDGLVSLLRHHGISVTTYTNNPEPARPDAVFPNNWISTWPSGQIYLYPMANENRRIERNPEIVSLLKNKFLAENVIDLSKFEAQNAFLESTGVMIFDHSNKIAYGGISPRCDHILFESHARHLGYAPISFHAYDPNGVAIYHANIVLAVQRTTAVLYTAGITDLAERELVTSTLRKTGHEIVDITFDQLKNFCANTLELCNDSDERFLVMSQGAYDAFTPAQRDVLSRDKTIISTPLTTIEAIGGGSARCMLAELFLSVRKQLPLRSASAKTLVLQ